MPVIDVTKSDEFKKLTTEHPAVVDYSATWCGPCRRVEPVFKELAETNPEIKFLHIDIDEASESMPNELSSIHSVPTFKFFFGGKQVDTFSGANVARIRENVEKLKSLSALGDKSKTAEKAKDESEPESKTSKIEPEAENKVVHAKTKEEFAKFLSLGKTVVDFSASWCFPCKMIAPTFSELAKDSPGINFVKVDIDEASEELSEILKGVSGVPTFYFYSNGDLIDRMSGANAATLKEKVKKLAAATEKKEEQTKDENKKEDEAKKEEEKTAEEKPAYDKVKEKRDDKPMKSEESASEAEKPKENQEVEIEQPKEEKTKAESVGEAAAPEATTASAQDVAMAEEVKTEESVAKNEEEKAKESNEEEGEEKKKCEETGEEVESLAEIVSEAQTMAAEELPVAEASPNENRSAIETEQRKEEIKESDVKEEIEEAT